MNIDQLRIELETLRRDYPILEEDDATRLDTLDGATDIREVLTRLNRALDNAKGLEAGVRSRIDELLERENRFEARIDFLRELIFKVLESANLKKFELAEATISLRNNGMRLAGEADPQSLPDDLCKITRTVDRKKVREAIDAGREVPGFHLSNAQPSLVVKVK